ncbi:conserved membrane hypothetical protein [Desulfosarcina cetonica]|nr:conserved membrane hypothetical protein [Desulfosarcina cetonica]
MSELSPSAAFSLEARPNGLILAEQAVFLLRRRGAPALFAYYIGTFPFVLGLLFFWSDMSRNPFGRWYCAPAAAGLALLFIWMKLWQVRFGWHLSAVLQADRTSPWTLGQWVAVAARQAGLQATGWIVLPLASLIMLPMGWAYAFYQNLTVMDGPQQKKLNALIAEAQGQAALLPGQNHLMLTVMTLFGLVVLANMVVFLILAPQLLQRLLGVETVFSLSGNHLLNTTFLVVACSLTYLCVDPIVKTAYVLRCYFGRARRTGEDIRHDLGRYAAVVVTVVIVLLNLGPPFAIAGPPPAVSVADPAPLMDAGHARRLDRAIDQVLQQRHFAWRLARETVADSPEMRPWLDRTVTWLVDSLSAVWRTVGNWLHQLWEWLTRWLPETDKQDDQPAGTWRGRVKTGLFLLGGALLVGMLGWLFRRLTLRRRRRTRRLHPPVVQPVDLTDESITARDLPADRWLSLAAEMLARDHLRRALRALYLAVLAVLADHGQLIIARHKTNRDYFAELTRRQRNAPELLALFDRCRQTYDRVWYGMHAVSAEQVARFKSCQERITDLVRSSV